MVKEPTPGIVAAVGPALNVPVTPAMVNVVTLGVAPSTSVVFASKPEAAGTVSVVSSVTVLVSLPSTGASFTGVTVIISFAVAEPP